jgi:hypothetical protein
LAASDRIIGRRAYGGVLVVRAQIGELWVSLLVDTGCAVTSLTREAAERLGSIQAASPSGDLSSQRRALRWWFRKRSVPQHEGTVEGLAGRPAPQGSQTPGGWREDSLYPRAHS